MYFSWQIFWLQCVCAVLWTSNIHKGYEHIPASRCGFYDLLHPGLQVMVWINAYFLPFYFYTRGNAVFSSSAILSICALQQNCAPVLFQMHRVARSL